MTDENKLKELLKRYFEEQCTNEEKETLAHIIANTDDSRLNGILSEVWTEYGQRDYLSDEKTKQILSAIITSTHNVHAAKKDRSIRLKKWYFRVASVAAVLLLLLTVVLIYKKPEAGSGEMTMSETGSTANRISRLILHDGSTVMLRNGSWLYITNSFEGDSREVNLEGEAFFDIVSNPSKPFVIHTGSLTTTVLGTAFSIKALPNDSRVTVTVMHGKVKVKNGEKLLAMLEADNQLVYDTETDIARKKPIDAEKETDWRTHDLIFSRTTFEVIVKQLGKMYGVTIEFENESLKKRLITASLDDRDDIETILEIICTSQRASYVMEGNTYIIKSQNNDLQTQSP